MRWKKKSKTISETSVSDLLDEFIDPDIETETQESTIDDAEYINMMVRKEDQRVRVREKYASTSLSEDQESSSEGMSEHAISAEDTASADDETKSQMVQEERNLTGRTKIAVEFLRHEIVTSEAKRNARKTLEKYRKDYASPMMKKEKIVISEKHTPLKNCQSCYFSIREKRISGSCWCHCTNPARSAQVVAKGSWVKSGLNLPCWKPQSD
jgi:hypothetical protein